MVGGQKASWGLSGRCQRPLAPIPVELLRVPMLIWISDLSSLPCCSPEELMKQPLEDVFLFLHRVLSRRSTAASVASCYMGHSAALRSYRCPKRAGLLPRQAVLERLQGSWDVGSWGRRRTRSTEAAGGEGVWHLLAWARGAVLLLLPPSMAITGFGLFLARSPPVISRSGHQTELAL